MGNDKQFIDVPPPAFNNAATTSVQVTNKDGIIALQTPVEPIDCRQTLLDEAVRSPKEKSSSSVITIERLFLLLLFIFFIILICYVLFRNNSIDQKLNHLTNDDIRLILDEINRRIQFIERTLIEQNKKLNLNLQLNAQDLRELSSNQTLLHDFIQRYRDHH